MRIAQQGIDEGTDMTGVNGSNLHYLLRLKEA